MQTRKRVAQQRSLLLHQAQVSNSIHRIDYLQGMKREQELLCHITHFPRWHLLRLHRLLDLSPTLPSTTSPSPFHLRGWSDSLFLAEVIHLMSCTVLALWAWTLFFKCSSVKKGWEILTENVKLSSDKNKDNIQVEGGTLKQNTFGKLPECLCFHVQVRVCQTQK